MAKPEIYNNALEKFKAEYNLPGYDLEKEIAADNVTRFFNNKSIGASAQQYERLAANAALKYFESSTTFQENGSKQLKGFDHSKFIADFEALMQARYDSKLEEGVEAEKRTPFDGSDKEKLKIAINASANKVNKPLAELWADKLKSGALKIEDVKMTATLLHNALFASNAKKEEMGGKLRDFVAAREAVKELRESRKGIRGFFWKLFNREQNRQEKELLEILELEVKALEDVPYEYDVNSAFREATSVTPWGKNLLERSNAVDLSIDKREPEKFPMNVEEEKVNISVNEVNDNIKEIAEDNVVSRLEPIINDREYIEEFSEKLFAAVPNGKELVQGKEKEFVTLFSATLKLLIQNYNGKYDKMQANKQDPEPLVKSMLDLVFADASTSFSNIIGYKTTEEKLLAAQIMSDMIMKEFTPVRFQPEKYGKYASGYVLNNVEEFRDIAKENKKDIAAAKAKFNHEVPEQSLASENPNYLNNIEFDPGESYSHDEFYDDNESEVKHEEVEEERANVGVAFDDESFERLREYFASNGGGVIYRPLEPKPGIKKVTEEANAIYEDTIKKEQFIKDLANRLPENSVSMDDKLFIIGNELHGIYLNIKNENENYDFFRSDDSYADMVDDCLPTMVSGVFQVSTFLAGKLGYTNNRDKLVVAQLITDMAMREYSPVRFIKGLEEYAQAYALMHSKDDNFKERFADVKPKDIREAANEYGNILKGLPMKPIIEDKEEENVNYMRFPNGKQSVEQSEEIDDEDYSDDEEYIDEEEQKKFADQLKADIEGKSVEAKSVQVESKENLVKKNVIE